MQEPAAPSSMPARERDLAPSITALLLVLWCCYSLNGFRGWWVPIELSDDNAGAAVRQALFAGSALVAAGVLWVRGALWATARTQWPIVALAAWLLATTLYSDLPSTTLKRAVLFGCGSVTAATVVAVAQDPLRRAGLLLVLVASIAAWVSVLWWVAFPPAITTNPGRPGLAGISNHPNTLAPAMAIGLVLALGVPRVSKPMRALAIIGCALALGLTTSVTSIVLGLASGGIAIALMLPSYWRALALTITVGFGVAAIALGLGRVRDALLGSVGRDASMSGRGDLWAIVWTRVQERPLFGRGWGAFWTEGKGRDLVGTWNPRQSHNAYLDVLLDVGLVGLAMFAVVLIPTVWRLLRIWKQGPTPDSRLAAAMLGVLFGLCTLYALQQSFLGKVDAFAFIATLLITAAAARATRPGDPQLAGPRPAQRARSTP